MICIKFAQDIEKDFFEELGKQFSKLQHFEEKMKDISLQAAQGKFGRIGGGLDLNINF